jgi:branched-chain amino acid transport system substrate-binding protein
VCKMAITPDDSQRCANELLTKKPFAVFSSINFFGNQFPIYAAAKTPVIVITPITVGDFTSPGVYSIGGGGGCLGAHTGLVKFVTSNLKAKKVGIPWADTPPGVVCYYDLEAKPMDVLNGKVKGSSSAAGSIPDLTYLGVPIKPATPDVTPEVTQILDFKPDAMMFSAQGADCWNFVNGLGRLGWKPDAIPLVMSGSCIDFAAMKAAGDLAKGVYFVGSSGSLLNDPKTITDPLDKFEAITYQTKGKQYGLDATNLTKGFATQGFTGLMSLWELSSQIVVKGDQLTPESLEKAYAATDNQHTFGSSPLSCSKAPTPYVAVCNSVVSATKWDGTQLVPVVPRFSGIDLVAGTVIKPGP